MQNFVHPCYAEGRNFITCNMLWIPKLRNLPRMSAHAPVFEMPEQESHTYPDNPDPNGPHFRCSGPTCVHCGRNLTCDNNHWNYELVCPVCYGEECGKVVSQVCDCRIPVDYSRDDPWTIEDPWSSTTESHTLSSPTSPPTLNLEAFLDPDDGQHVTESPKPKTSSLTEKYFTPNKTIVDFPKSTPGKSSSTHNFSSTGM